MSAPVCLLTDLRDSGWLASGDEVTLTEDGLLVIVDRIKVSRIFFTFAAHVPERFDLGNHQSQGIPSISQRA